MAERITGHTELIGLMAYPIETFQFTGNAQ